MHANRNICGLKNFILLDFNKIVLKTQKYHIIKAFAKIFAKAFQFPLSFVIPLLFLAINGSIV
jgi:hypothetical protein